MGLVWTELRIFMVDGIGLMGRVCWDAVLLKWGE